jgi:uncharacterized protein YlxW (UPF0749 family)
LKNHTQSLLFITLLILGIFLSIQVKSTLENNQKQSLKKLRAEQLKTELANGEKLVEQLDKSIAQNEKKLHNYINTSTNNEDKFKTMELLKEVNEAELKSGLTSVKGPGIILNIDDAEHAPDENRKSYIIHNSDLYKLLNEIKISRAQAISINDERIISTSEQMCAGSMIKINNNKYPPPYEIKAIGDPDQMQQQIESSGIYSDLKYFNIRIKIAQEAEIKISRYNNDINKLTSFLEVVKK